MIWDATSGAHNGKTTFIDATSGRRITFSDLWRAVNSLASSLSNESTQHSRRNRQTNRRLQTCIAALHNPVSFLDLLVLMVDKLNPQICAVFKTCCCLFWHARNKFIYSEITAMPTIGEVLKPNHTARCSRMLVLLM